jgi:hypothetical protein
MSSAAGLLLAGCLWGVYCTLWAMDFRGWASASLRFFYRRMGGWLWPGGSEQSYVSFYLRLGWLGVALGLTAIGFGLAGVVAFGGTPP